MMLVTSPSTQSNACCYIKKLAILTNKEFNLLFNELQIFKSFFFTPMAINFPILSYTLEIAIFFYIHSDCNFIEFPPFRCCEEREEWNSATSSTASNQKNQWMAWLISFYDFRKFPNFFSFLFIHERNYLAKKRRKKHPRVCNHQYYPS